MNRKSNKPPQTETSSTEPNNSPAVTSESIESKDETPPQAPKKRIRLFSRIGERYKNLPKYGKYIVDGCTIGGFLLGVIALYFVFRPPTTKPDPQPSPQPSRKFAILVPLASNSSEWNKFMQKKDGTYEERYNNQASQNIRDIVKIAKAQWLRDNKNSKLKEDDIDFFCFPEGFDEDDTSYRKAFNHAVEITIGSGREIIGLLGNVSSTSTKIYGDFCSKKDKIKEAENSNNNKKDVKNNTEAENINSSFADSDNKNLLENDGIPMILPLATATSLIRDLDLKKVPAVLRLPPANDKQAAKISYFLLQKGVFKTVILKDLTNEIYSNDLIEKFRESYVQKPLSDKASDFGEIVATIPIGGKETSPFLYSALSGGENGLVIAGMTNSAIETLAQAKASNSGFKAIFLTDGAVDEYLGKRIKKVQNENSVKNLYLSFPSPCPLDNALVNYLQSDSSLNMNNDDFKFTHSLFVADGVYIIISALDSGIKQPDAVPGNKILIDFINDLKQKAEITEKNWIMNHPTEPLDKAQRSVSVNINLPFNNTEKRDYFIDKFGNNTNADYYLFQLDNNSNWIPLAAQSTQNCSKR